MYGGSGRNEAGNQLRQDWLIAVPFDAYTYMYRPDCGGIQTVKQVAGTRGQSPRVEDSSSAGPSTVSRFQEKQKKGK